MYSLCLFFVACILHSTSAFDTELSERIIGGKFANLQEHPYMGYLIRKYGEYYELGCGATILSPKYFLSAAHCFKQCYCDDFVDDDDCHMCEEAAPEDFTLYFGINPIDRNATYASFIDRFHIHPDYKTYDNKHKCAPQADLAVGELSKELVFSDYINKVQLPTAITKDQVNDTSVKTTQWAANNTLCKAIGWGNVLGGKLDKSPYQGRNLKSLKLRLISNENCLSYLFFSLRDNIERNKKLKNYGLCYNTELCTIDPVFKSDACIGDSGGPLICEGTQVGIISQGINADCVGKYHPAKYARLDIYVSWINWITDDD